jgi:hypothetical protein
VVTDKKCAPAFGRYGERLLFGDIFAAASKLPGRRLFFSSLLVVGGNPARRNTLMTREVCGPQSLSFLLDCLDA